MPIIFFALLQLAKAHNTIRFFALLIFSSRSLKLPEAFDAFFGKVAAIASMGLARLFSYFGPVQKILTPVIWFWIFIVLTVVCWTRLSCFMDTGKYSGVKMLSKDAKDKLNWKEINKISMFKFKQVKYLLLALTTL